jgi:periplasmic protein TonB
MAALLLALVGGLLWHLLSDTASQRRELPQTALLSLPPPPPPPPPPEPEKLPEPEPEKTPKITEPTPEPEKLAEKPMEDKAPDPAKDLGDPVTLNGEAQAGTDAFGVQSGKGGGRAGTGAGGGLGGGSYARYVSSRLQQALSRDARTRSLVFDDLRLDLWLGTDGKATRVELVRGTGTERVDALVLKVLRELDALDERPPAAMRYPIRVAIRGVRP